MADHAQTTVSSSTQNTTTTSSGKSHSERSTDGTKMPKRTVPTLPLSPPAPRTAILLGQTPPPTTRDLPPPPTPLDQNAAEMTMSNLIKCYLREKHCESRDDFLARLRDNISKQLAIWSDQDYGRAKIDASSHVIGSVISFEYTDPEDLDAIIEDFGMHYTYVTFALGNSNRCTLQLCSIDDASTAAKSRVRNSRGDILKIRRPLHTKPVGVQSTNMLRLGNVPPNCLRNKSWLEAILTEMRGRDVKIVRDSITVIFPSVAIAERARDVFDALRVEGSMLTCHEL